MKPVELFNRWAEKRKPAYGTMESWGYVFAALQEKFTGRSAGSITSEEARRLTIGLPWGSDLDICRRCSPLAHGA